MGHDCVWAFRQLFHALFACRRHSPIDRRPPLLSTLSHVPEVWDGISRSLVRSLVLTQHFSLRPFFGPPGARSVVSVSACAV